MENLNNNQKTISNQEAIREMFNLLNSRVMPKKTYEKLLLDIQGFAEEVNEGIFFKNIVRLEFIKNMN